MSNLIDRDALVKAFREKADLYTPHMFATESECNVAKIVAMECAGIAKDAPTVDAEPVRHASWILERDEMRRIYTTCDNCKTCVCFTNYRNGMKVDMRGANYCPNCGAKVDKEEHDG